MLRYDLTNQTFGSLTVLKYIGKDKWKNSRWLCKCTCGNEIIALLGNLRHNKTKSCGCMRGNKHEQIIPGMIFGQLTVIELAQNNKKKKYWKCKCVCGKITIVRDCSLKDRKKGVRSCGCLTIIHSKKQITKINPRYQGTNLKIMHKNTNRNNSTGINGVNYSKASDKYIARIGIKGKRIFIGAFTDINEAAEARQKAEDIYYAPIINDYLHENER